MVLQDLERQNLILRNLNRLPRLMTQIHGRENLSQFLLHELCSESCFNLSKAAYFVDNPDFNCLHGLAGFSQDQAFPLHIWQNPNDFSTHMNQAEFNNKVRSISHQSIRQNNKQILEDLAKTLNMSSGSNCSWNMRHDNYGVLLYEKADPGDTLIDDHLLDGMSLLSFCPVF